MASSRDDARAVLSDPRAPESERYDAQAELDRQYRPLASALIPAEDLQPVIAAIQEGLAQEALAKAQVIDFPGRHRQPPRQGMQSVYLDDMQTQTGGEWYEKPGAMSFDSLRAMVEGTPLLNSIILTRIRQVSRFCAPSEDGGIGFAIRHVERDHEDSDDEKGGYAALAKFFTHCGWEFNPRARKKLKRDNFSTFAAKLVRDSLTYDAAPIETEMKRNSDLGIDGLYAVDGSTIRLCTDDGYEGDEDIFAVQVVQGRVAAAYTRDDLIYEVRNPRTDVRLAGYGLGETELLVKTVTAFLNAMTYNAGFFDQNAIPKGVLQLTGDYAKEDLDVFRRGWNAMVRGIDNRWSLPVLISKDAEGKANYLPFNTAAEEMAYAKWMTLLASIACAIYGMDPEEISFESFSASKSTLSGSDTEEKLTSSKDKGLRPLMSYLENTLSDFVVSATNPDWCFRWVGLDEEDKEKEWEGKKLILSVDELRAEQGYGPYPDPDLGAAPLNPQLVGPWMQLRHPPAQPPGADFGGQGDGQDFEGESGPDANPGEPMDHGAGDTGEDGTMNGPDKPGDFGGPPAEGEFGKALDASIGTIYGIGRR